MKTVVLDPGHGGSQPGAASDGLVEKALALSIAQKVAAELAEHGVRVLLTRQTDTTVDIDARPKVAARHHADIFLSIHANAASSPAARGAEAWFRSGSKEDATFTRTLLHKIAGYEPSIPLRGAFPDDTNRHGRLGVLHGHLPTTRAALLEIGFLTNKQDRMVITGERYPQALAKAILAILQMAPVKE